MLCNQPSGNGAQLHAYHAQPRMVHTPMVYPIRYPDKSLVSEFRHSAIHDERPRLAPVHCGRPARTLQMRNGHGANRDRLCDSSPQTLRTAESALRTALSRRDRTREQF